MRYLVYRILAICGLLFAAPLAMSAQVEFVIRGVELSKGYSYTTHHEKPLPFLHSSLAMNIGSPQPILKIEVEVKNTGNDTIPIFESPGISDKFFLTCKIDGKAHKNAVFASPLANNEEWSIAPGDSYVFNLFDWSGAPEENFHQWFFDIFDSIEVEYHRRTSVNEYRSEVKTYTARVADWDGLMIRGVPRGPNVIDESAIDELTE